MKTFRALAREFVIFGLVTGALGAVIGFAICTTDKPTLSAVSVGVIVCFGVGALAGFILWSFYRAIRFAVQG
jgi:hypothetical protein